MNAVCEVPPPEQREEIRRSVRPNMLAWTRRTLMGLTQTVLFYLLFGISIAAAVALRRERVSWTEQIFQVGTAVFFWPLYLPILLDRPAQRVRRAKGEYASDPSDHFAESIAQVETELEAALDSLDGWAENVLAREQDRFAELRSAWRMQAERIRQLDQLLAVAKDANNVPGTERELDVGPGKNVRYQQSEQARRENFERLQSVRVRLHDDLLGTLAWVRELVSMIHLAKFTGAPASRADELVSQIATAVEGLSEVTQWKEDNSAAAS